MMTKIGLRMLKKMPVIPVQSDKNHGYVLHTENDIREIKEAIMSKDMYEEVHPYSIPKNLNETYVNLCKRVAELEGNPSLSELTRSMFVGSTFISRLLITCKDHKEQGMITHRNIHANHCYSHKGLSKWLAMRLEENLHSRTSASYIVKDIPQFIESVQSLRVPEGAYLMHLDIKDFFLTGTETELTQPIREGYDATDKKLVLDVAEFLLSSQYVRCDETPGRVWRAVHGAGQGLAHSGAIASFTFNELVEQVVCSESFMRDHGIWLYRRYHDDIILGATKTELTLKFTNRMHDLSKPYIIKCEKVVREGKCQFLSAMLEIKDNRMSITPVIKSDKPPLAESSAHPSHVHSAWKRAYLRSALRNTSRDAKLIQETRQQVAERFTMYGEKPPDEPSSLRLNDRMKEDQPLSERPLWIALPHHVQLEKPVKQALSSFSSDAFNQSLHFWSFGFPNPRVRAAWRIDTPRHAQKVQPRRHPNDPILDHLLDQR
jgi:hypothetical protein